MPTSLELVAAFGYGCTGLAFFGLFLFLLRNRLRNDVTWMLIAAVLMSVVWATSSALYSLSVLQSRIWPSLSETLRDAGWIGFLVMLLAQSWRLSLNVRISLPISVLLGFVFAAQILTDIAKLFSPELAGLLSTPGASGIFLMSRLLVAIGGLVLTHNLYVNAAPGGRWGLRYMCIALGTLFAYDLNLYALAALYGGVNPDLFTARGTINLLLVPLIGVASRRQKSWNMEMRVSRQVVFTTLSLVAIGGYFVTIATGTYLLRVVGGNFVTLLQIIFITVTMTALALLLFSGTLRSWAMVKIAKHFFAYKYDYRSEWLRFIATISGRFDEAEPLQQRIIRGLCDIVDSPGGSLWQSDGNAALRMVARYNFSTAGQGMEPLASPLVQFLEARGRIVDFGELYAGDGDYDGALCPTWATPETRSWLAVPLIHSGALKAFVVIERPRAARTLNWEDFDLLRTVGQQAASYLAEQSSQQALAENAEFEAFNRRFAFVIHDIKNLASQIGVLSRNAQKHVNNPEFQQDMIHTLDNSVHKMNDLLSRLRHQRSTGSPRSPVGLSALVSGVANEKSKIHPQMHFAGTTDEVLVHADAGRLEQVFQHLIQNAIDSGPSTPVLVCVEMPEGRHDFVHVRIVDRGCGMSEAFLREKLFRPFASTKEGGMGIGAYEARQIVEDHGGRILVKSVVGQGSEFEIILPVSAAGNEQSVPDLFPVAGPDMRAA